MEGAFSRGGGGRQRGRAGLAGALSAGGVRDRAVFRWHIGKRWLPARAVLFCGGLAGGRDPVGALPTRKLAHHRAALQQGAVQRAAPYAAGGGLLAVGEVIGIEQAQSLGHAAGEIGPVALERLHPRDVHAVSYTPLTLPTSDISYDTVAG